MSRDRHRGPPRGLERDRPAPLGNEGLETADGAVGAGSGYPHDEMRELIEPWVERGDTRHLEDAAERRERQHAIRVVDSRTDPDCRGHERSEKHDPKHADDHTENDVPEGRASHGDAATD